MFRMKEVENQKSLAHVHTEKTKIGPISSVPDEFSDVSYD